MPLTMAETQDPEPVKLLCGMLSVDTGLLDEAAAAMTGAFGAVDLTSETMDFDFTHYYDAEMGSPLLRRFVSFAQLAGPDTLAQAKRTTNELERDFARRPDAACPRPINLDPGYVETSKLVLASMKNFAHRIYLGGGVYAELALLYRHGAWRPLPWTFPDYASPRYHPFLAAVRDRLREQMRREARS